MPLLTMGVKENNCGVVLSLSKRRKTKRAQMSIKRYFQNFVDFGVYLTDVLEIKRIQMSIKRFFNILWILVSIKGSLNRLLNVSRVESPLFEGEKTRTLCITPIAFSLANMLFYDSADNTRENAETNPDKESRWWRGFFSVMPVKKSRKSETFISVCKPCHSRHGIITDWPCRCFSTAGFQQLLAENLR